MLCRHNATDVERKLIEADPTEAFPRSPRRRVWREVAARLGEEALAERLRAAEEAAGLPIPTLTASMYLDFQRSGRREGYQKPLKRRRRMLADLVIGECLEGRGRFLGAAMDLLWAICEESSWAWPAHQVNLGRMEAPYVDLLAAHTAMELAEARHLIGPDLDPAVNQRIAYEVTQRVLDPFLTRHDYWWMAPRPGRRANNWTAVCVGGVVGAAVYVDPDRARLAELIARGARCLDDYLASFGVDGASEEGVSYWSYGFGAFVVLAHLVEHYSVGTIPFMDEDILREIARFPLRTRMDAGAYATFSDSHERPPLRPALLAWLSRRLDIPDLMRLARESRSERAGNLTWALRDLFWRPSDEPGGDFVPARCDWMPDVAWMISRFDPEDPAALSLAVKGGDNNSSHNHNDLGAVVVRAFGKTFVLDPEPGAYVKKYFSGGRYEIFNCRSFGHAVPLPNGVEQRAAPEFVAETLERESTESRDRLRLDLTRAYPAEADVKSLVREVSLRRDTPRGAVEIVDEATFGSGAGTLTSQLVTSADVELGGDGVTLGDTEGAVTVRFDPKTVGVEVIPVAGVEMAGGPKDFFRVLFRTRVAAAEAEVRLRIESRP